MLFSSVRLCRLTLATCCYKPSGECILENVEQSIEQSFYRSLCLTCVRLTVVENPAFERCGREALQPRGNRVLIDHRINEEWRTVYRG